LSSAPHLQDPKTGEEHDVVISKDDGVRPGTTAQSLSKLRAVFKKDGTTTAGNSSQVFLWLRTQIIHVNTSHACKHHTLSMCAPCPCVYRAELHMWILP